MTVFKCEPQQDYKSVGNGMVWVLFLTPNSYQYIFLWFEFYSQCSCYVECQQFKTLYELFVNVNITLTWFKKMLKNRHNNSLKFNIIIVLSKSNMKIFWDKSAMFIMIFWYNMKMVYFYLCVPAFHFVTAKIINLSESNAPQIPSICIS